MRRKISGIGIFYYLILRDENFGERHLKRIQEAAPEADILVLKSRKDWTEAVAQRCASFDIFLGIGLLFLIISFIVHTLALLYFWDLALTTSLTRGLI